MGTQFSIVYDIIVAAVIICMSFAGWKKGFAKFVIGTLTTVIAFAAAMLLSEPLAETVYEKYVERPISEKIDSTVNGALTSLELGRFCELDFDAISISGIPASEYEPNYEGKASAVIDMTDLDFSRSGLKMPDLLAIGAPIDSDLSSVNALTAEFTRSEIESYGMGKLAAAQYAAVNLVNKEELSDFNALMGIVGKFIPGEKSNSSADTIAVSAVRKITVIMINSKTALSDAVMNEMIRPECVIAMRTVIFTLIFVLTTVVLGLIASAAELINKIPVVGKANKLLGLIAGLCEALVIVFVACLITRFFVSLGGDSTILFNRSTIDNTFLFKKFYDMDFLNFLI